MGKKVEKFLRVWRILRYLKMKEERHPSNIHLRRIMKICHSLGFHPHNVGKPLIKYCIENGFIEAIDVEIEGKMEKYYKITSEGKETYLFGKKFFGKFSKEEIDEPVY